MRARRWSLSVRDISVLNYSSVFASVDRLRFIFILTVLINTTSLAASFGNDHPLSPSLPPLFFSLFSQDTKWLLVIHWPTCFTIAIQFPQSAQFDNGYVSDRTPCTTRYLRKYVHIWIMHLSKFGRESDWFIALATPHRHPVINGRVDVSLTLALTFKPQINHSC